jgi:hypothetical protein
MARNDKRSRQEEKDSYEQGLVADQGLISKGTARIRSHGLISVFGSSWSLGRHGFDEAC